jgi:antirestriction protein ArdC
MTVPVTRVDENGGRVLCHYTVFNVEQCNGLMLPEEPPYAGG